MKKILAMMLTAVMMLSMGTAVFADDVTYADSEAKDGAFNIKKTYSSTETFVPGETLNFTVDTITVPDGETASEAPVITVGADKENKFTISGDAETENQIPINLPSYDTVGVYEYVIKEVKGNTAGVITYDTTKEIHVIVLVEYDNDNHKLVIGNTTSYIKKMDGTKTDEFENVFKTGDFTVEKDVEGNLANENDEFEIKVTLTTNAEVLTPIKVAGVEVAATGWTSTDAVEDDPATEEIDETKAATWTYTTTLTLSESKGATAFTDVPYNVTVKVEELNNNYDSVSYSYTVGGNKTSSDTFVVSDTTAAAKVVVLNQRGTTVDTGISVDSIPYIAILVVVAIVGTGLVISRKRRYED